MQGTTRRVVGIIAGVALLFVLGPAALASAATTNKPYSLRINPGMTTDETTPGEVASGETVDITATIKNETSTQQVGSANLFPPGGFSASSATIPPPAMASVSQKCTDNGLAAGACVQLRNLALAPGASVTVTMSVATPACQQAGVWSAEVKQSNNFNGTPGNDFSFDSSNSQPSTTLDGACYLAFHTQPQDEILSNAIDGAQPWFTGGPIATTPVTVEVRGSDDTTVISSFRDAPVNAVLVNPGVATLVGTNPQPASNGTASFNDLQITAPADGYQLSMSSGTLMGATSTTFDVAGAVASCSGGGNSCHTDVAGNNGDASVTATTTTSSGSGMLFESANAFNAAQLICTGPASIDSNTYNYFTTAGLVASKVAVITVTGVKITGSVMKFLHAQQICFGGSADFPAVGGTTAGNLPDGSAGFIGVLPPCTGSSTGPCHDQNSDSATLVGSRYTVTLVADIPSSYGGDPYMR